jgi:hypothetical protein
VYPKISGCAKGRGELTLHVCKEEKNPLIVDSVTFYRVDGYSVGFNRPQGPTTLDSEPIKDFCVKCTCIIRYTRTFESCPLSSFFLIRDILLKEADLFLIGDRELNAPGSMLLKSMHNCMCVCVQ